jgi:hypothetical protein
MTGCCWSQRGGNAERLNWLLNRLLATRRNDHGYNRVNNSAMG